MKATEERAWENGAAAEKAFRRVTDLTYDAGDAFLAGGRMS